MMRKTTVVMAVMLKTPFCLKLLPRYSIFCILTDEGLRSETSESNSVRNVLPVASMLKNSSSITNAVMSLYDIIKFSLVFRHFFAKFAKLSTH